MAHSRIHRPLLTSLTGHRFSVTRSVFRVEAAIRPSRQIASTVKKSTAASVRHKEDITLQQLPQHSTQQIASNVLQKRPLRAMPFTDLLRSLAVLSLTTLPKPLWFALIRAANSNIKLLESNRVLRWIVSNTFYNHFCVGSSQDDIVAKTEALRKMGMTGVVLTYAREAPKAEPGSAPPSTLAQEDTALQGWVESNFRTIEILAPGDYIALRVTGAGPTAVSLLERYTQASVQGCGPPGFAENITAELKQEHRVLEDALRRICAKSKDKHVRVLIDAEGSRYQHAIDDISLNLMAEFNRGTDGGRATIMNTYQLYLKQNILKIQRHLRHSVENNYVLGLKLVRGAYMYAELDRDIIHDSKQQTDDAYDTAVSFLLDDKIQSEEGSKLGAWFENWRADVVLATHNSYSVQQALQQYKSRGGAGGRVCGLPFAQLMGMADELSLSLSAQLGSFCSTSAEQISTNRQRSSSAMTASAQDSRLPGDKYPEVGVYKYTVWGSLSDCLLYMLRRAEENSDALARSRATVFAMLKELSKRILFLGR